MQPGLKSDCRLGKLVAAFTAADSSQSTGGDRYNMHLLKAWESLIPITYAPVRYRWFLLRCYALALVVIHHRALRDAEFLFQAATSIYSSARLIRWCRRVFPRLQHIGAVHHPRWLEEPGIFEWERAYLNSFDYLIVISEHVHSNLIKAGVNPPIYLLLPGKAKMPPRMVPPVDPPMILWNGYLLPRKGAWTLLEALARLRSMDWQAQFVVSNRASAQLYHQFNQALGVLTASVRARIQVFDRLPIESFREQFFRASIFCLPSLVEGYSISTAEAMSCGCAVVVPRTENFLELIGKVDYAGFYDPDDPEDLARKLDLLLSDASLREASASYCLGRSASLPDWEQFKTRACDLLRQIVPDVGSEFFPSDDHGASASR